MNTIEIAVIGKELHDNYYTKYHKEVIKTYKYRGEIKTRKEIELTDEGRALQMGELLNRKAFFCPCCKRLVSFNELEYWGEDIEDIITNKITCSECYEEAMGEDL